MGRFLVLFTCVMTVGCLRPVWADGMTTTPLPSARNGALPPVVDEDAEDADDTDHYRVTFDHATLRPWRVVFYVSSTEEYRLGCRWQGDNCMGLLPEDARDSAALLIGLPRRLCSRIRIYREDEELGVIERFRWGCGFMLETPP